MYSNLGDVEGETSSNWSEPEMLLLQQAMELAGKNLSPVPVLCECSTWCRNYTVRVAFNETRMIYAIWVRLYCNQYVVGPHF